MTLKASDEALLTFKFGAAETMHGGSTSGRLFELAALYRVPKPAPKRTKTGKLIRDEDFDAAQKQWRHVRAALEKYAAGRATLVALFGYLPTEKPWRTDDERIREALPRVAAAFAEIDRLYAEWQAGTIPSEAMLRRWIINEALPIKSARSAPEITARPTAELKSSQATEPAHRDLLRAAAAGRILQKMGRAKRLAEVDALATLYGPAGQHFLDQGLPRHWALAAATQAGVALLAHLPRDKRPGSYGSWANLWHARDSVTYADYAEDFAATELACERLEARACRAWEVAKEATGVV